MAFNPSNIINHRFISHIVCKGRWYFLVLFSASGLTRKVKEANEQIFLDSQKVGSRTIITDGKVAIIVAKKHNAGYSKVLRVEKHWEGASSVERPLAFSESLKNKERKAL